LNHYTPYSQYVDLLQSQLAPVKKTNSIYKEWDVLERRYNDQYEN